MKKLESKGLIKGVAYFLILIFSFFFFFIYFTFPLNELALRLKSHAASHLGMDFQFEQLDLAPISTVTAKKVGLSKRSFTGEEVYNIPIKKLEIEARTKKELLLEEVMVKLQLLQ